MAMIKICDDFQYSVNLGFDFGDVAKVENYVLTESALGVLKAAFTAASQDGRDKSHILSAPYGKGKSHLALVILKLLSSKRVVPIERQIAAMDANFYAELRHFQENGRFLLPVIVEHRAGERAENSFLRALKKSLGAADLPKIASKTQFFAAKEAIGKWRNDFPQAFGEFERLCGDADDFVLRLENFDEKALAAFLAIYPKVTAGSVFFCDDGLGAVDFYRETAKNLAKCGFSGIFVVFDEFGKFLESNAENADDLKFLQDFAESANRSRGNEQVHLLLLAHQSIANYVEGLSQTQIGDWKAVSERFSPLSLSSSPPQYFRLIAKIIQHDERQFAQFLSKNCNKISPVFEKFAKNPAFCAFENAENLFEKTFPLHPATLFLLPALSEKIAQNERTIFTFLASKSQKNGLFDFISSHDLQKNCEFLTPDFAFDYFSAAFFAENFASPIFQIAQKAKVALDEIADEKNPVFAKIVKTAAILQIAGCGPKMPCNEAVLSNIFGDEAKIATKSLRSRNILERLEFSREIVFPEIAKLDVEAKIEAKIAGFRESPDAILTEFAAKTAFYPAEYNAENGVTRFFRLEFAKNPSNADFVLSIEKKFADGIIFLTASGADDFAKIDANGAICINLRSQQDMKKLAFRMKAAKMHVEEAENSAVKAAFLRIFGDCKKRFDDFLDEFFDFSKKNIQVFIEGELCKVADKMDFDSRISQSLQRRFAQYPVILNEMLVKNRVTSQSELHCKKVVEVLLSCGELQKNFGFNPGSQETSIVKSVFVKTGIFAENCGRWIFDPSGDLAMQKNAKFFAILQKVATDFQNGEKIAKIVGELQNEVGIRRGVLPLIFAAVLRENRQSAYFFDGDEKREQILNAANLFEICKNPRQICVRFVGKDAETEKYFSRMEEIFKKYENFSKKSANRQEKLLFAMQNYFNSLPKFTRENCDSAKIFRPIFSSGLNLNEFLLEKLPQNLGAAIAETPDAMGEKIGELDGFVERKLSELNGDLCRIFGADDGDEFYQIANTFAQSLSDGEKNAVFEKSFFLQIFAKKFASNFDFLRSLIVADTDFRIEDWTLAAEKAFLEDCKNFKKICDENAKKCGNSFSDADFAIKFVEGGEKFVRTFEFPAEKSLLAKRLLSKLKADFSDFAQSISAQEKCGCAFEVLKMAAKGEI